MICSEYMTGVYNQSFVRTYNLARGAATVDRDLVMPLFPSTWCFDEQVCTLPPLTTYSSRPPGLEMSSLFLCKHRLRSNGMEKYLIGKCRSMISIASTMSKMKRTHLAASS